MSFRVEQVGHVAHLTLSRPPHNFFDVDMLAGLADCLAEIDRDPGIRSTILMSDQRSFCAGADFGGDARPAPAPIYHQATRLMARRKPLVAAIGGGAVGGGLGLALVADIRVGDPKAWFRANFTRIGISAGFGISFTLPRVVGNQRARDILLTARKVRAEEALAIGLLDRMAGEGELGKIALEAAEELATNSPAAIMASRLLLGEGEQSGFAKAVERELEFQRPLFASADFDEGVLAARERRAPAFSDKQEQSA